MASNDRSNVISSGGTKSDEPKPCTKCNQKQPITEASSDPSLGWMCCDAARQCLAGGTSVVHSCLECDNLIMDWEEKGRSYLKHICTRCLALPASGLPHRYENKELCLACL